MERTRQLSSRHNRNKALRSAYATVFTVLVAGSVSADPLPRGNVRIVVPLAAGGPTDTLARIIADQLQNKLGRTFVVENKAGAGGNIGAASVAKSDPDGLTWLLGLDSIFTINPHLYKSLGFETNELAPVSVFGENAQLLVVNPSVQATTLSEFVTQSRSKQVSYASAGVGSPGHLTFEYLKKVTGLNAQHVPYRGNAPVVTDLLGGQVQAGFLASSGVLGYVQDKSLRPIAYSGRKRLDMLPNVPTVAESGFPEFEAQFAYVMMLPAKTSDEIKQFVAKEIADIFQKPEVREKLAAFAIEPTVSTPEEAVDWLARENKRWAEIAATTKIQAN